MKATGIVRRMDGLGRIVIPEEIRRITRIREGAPLEIYLTNDGGVVLKRCNSYPEPIDETKALLDSLENIISDLSPIDCETRAKIGEGVTVLKELRKTLDALSTEY